MEALVSLTCDDTTGVCPGTELTCTCSIYSPIMVWALPGSESIVFSNSDAVGSIIANGIFVAVVTNNTGGVLESVLIYTATESLVNATIECQSVINGEAVSTIITDTLAG